MVGENRAYGDRFPTSRLAYPGAPFASLWTQNPDDADRAYTLYHEALVKGRTLPPDDLLAVFAGRAFRVPAIEATHQYQIRWSSPPRPIPDTWIHERQRWICEQLVRNQSAYEMMSAHLKDYREGGHVEQIEVLSAPGACPVCVAAAGVRDLSDDIEIPVPGCTQAHGCRCTVIPVLKPLEEVPAPARETVTLPEPAELVTINDDLSIGLKLAGSAQAKAAIKQLKSEKKQVGLLKRQVTAEMRELKLAHRNENASRNPAMRGGGNLGKVVRAMQSTAKKSARNRQLDELAPLETRRANIETLGHSIDAAILFLEQYLHEQDSR